MSRDKFEVPEIHRRLLMSETRRLQELIGAANAELMETVEVVRKDVGAPKEFIWSPESPDAFVRPPAQHPVEMPLEAVEEPEGDAEDLAEATPV